jgi:hypothetical protein
MASLEKPLEKTKEIEETVWGNEDIAGRKPSENMEKL